MIYLDNAATTKVKREVVDAMLPYFTEEYGNPSAIYQYAGHAKSALHKARVEVASLLQVKPETIYFTSGGTESDNWALDAVMHMNPEKKHLIVSRIEHHAILHTMDALRREGFEVTVLPVDAEGFVNPSDVKAAICPDTALVSIMTANNEIGTIEPIEEIGAICQEAGVLFHTDAVQAFGQIPLHVDQLHVDLLSGSSHKIYGPKGVGFLYIRETVKMGSYQHGGAQERNRRAGTENVPGIVGFGKACEIAAKTMEDRMQQESTLRDHLIQRVLSEIPDSRLNGAQDSNHRLPNNANFSFKGIEGESMLIMLDMQNICASSGSACTAGSIDPSHVLIATGLSTEEARESIRLTLSDETTLEEIDTVVDALKKIVTDLRSMSPLYS